MDTQIKLRPQERIDYFKRERIQLIQSKDYFTMSLDAILLADFIQVPAKGSFRYLDFCTGNGVIPLLLSAKTQEKLYGMELQAGLVEMAQRSVQLNHLQDRVQILQQDISQLNLSDWLGQDVISCNPPYFVVDNSDAVHHLDSHALARHEITLTLNQWVETASRILKTKGKLFFVHRPDRLDDIYECLLAHRFAIHRMRFVHPKPGLNANVVLIEAIYQGGRRGVKIEPPLVVHEADNSYTQEMQAIYYG